MTLWGSIPTILLTLESRVHCGVPLTAAAEARLCLTWPLSLQGLEIHTTSNCLHFVSRVGVQVRAPTTPTLPDYPGGLLPQASHGSFRPQESLIL